MKQFRYQPVPFDEMPYARPDAEVQRAALVSAAEAMKSAKDYSAARKAFFDLQDAQEEFGTMFSLCSVRATMDTTDVFYEGEIRWLREEAAKLIPLKKAFDQALADSPFRSGTPSANRYSYASAHSCSRSLSMPTPFSIWGYPSYAGSSGIGAPQRQ